MPVVSQQASLTRLPCGLHNMGSRMPTCSRTTARSPALQARVEIGLLQLLNTRCDPRDEHHIVRMLDFFLFRKHLCLVFERLDVNLFELLKRNSFRGLSLSLVQVRAACHWDGVREVEWGRRCGQQTLCVLPLWQALAQWLKGVRGSTHQAACMAKLLSVHPSMPPPPQMFLRQLLNSLEVLRDAGIIHCDLKPENILLMNPQVGRLCLRTGCVFLCNSALALTWTPLSSFPPHSLSMSPPLQEPPPAMSPPLQVCSLIGCSPILTAEWRNQAHRLWVGLL